MHSAFVPLGYFFLSVYFLLFALIVLSNGEWSSSFFAPVLDGFVRLILSSSFDHGCLLNDGPVTRLMRAQSLAARCRSWLDNGGRRMLNRRRLFRKVVDHCWVICFDWRGLTEDEIVSICKAYGERISFSSFDTLATALGLVDPASLRVVGNHVFRDRELFKGEPLFRAGQPTWRFLGSPQSALDVAVSVNAAKMAESAATLDFKTGMSTAITVDNDLSPACRLAVEAAVDFPVVFRAGRPIVTDHPVLAALRGIVRKVYALAYPLGGVTTLVIGSSAREMHLYEADETVDHYFHGSEDKDYARTVLPLLRSLRDRVKRREAKASTSMKKRLRTGEDSHKALQTISFSSLSAIISAIKDLTGMPNGYFTSLSEIRPHYEELRFEDSAYEFGPKEWRDIFLRTGANTAVGYGFYPPELMFPDCSESRDYVYQYDPMTKKASVTYRNGVSNGYIHHRDTWASFLDNPIMNFPEFSLVFEVNRVGPYLYFRAVRTTSSNQPVVRRFELSEKEQFVRVLDLTTSVSSHGVLARRNYFSVRADEWWSAVDWAMSLDPKSVTFHNVMMYTRRTSAGVSLINKVLQTQWHLRKKDHERFALTVTAYVLKKIAAADCTLSHVAESKWIPDYLQALTSLPMTLHRVANTIAHHFVRTIEADQLVVFPDNFVDTKVYTPLLRAEGLKKYTVVLDHLVDEDPNHGCAMCQDLRPRLGAQILACTPGKQIGADEVDGGMTQSEIDTLMTEVIDNDNDPAGIAALKDRVKPRIPRTGFENVLKVHYLKGGPGTGKSYLIRAMATTEDFVYAPFTKLKCDYEKVPDPDNKTVLRDLRFATIHRGLEQGVCRYMFIDEFTALDWSYIRLVAYLTKPDMIFIVGDDGQTQVKEPDQGQYIGNHVDLESLPRHEMMVNFRSPRDTVMYLNEQYGYHMQPNAAASEESSIRVATIADPGDVSPTAFKMVYSHASVADFDLDPKATVKSNQGGTYDDVLLYVTSNDMNTSLVHGMDVVAFSRHKKTLTVLHDESPEVVAWLADHGLPRVGRLTPRDAKFAPQYSWEDVSTHRPVASDKRVHDLYEKAETVPVNAYRPAFFAASWTQILSVLSLVAYPFFPVASGLVAVVLANRIRAPNYRAYPMQLVKTLSATITMYNVHCWIVRVGLLVAPSWVPRATRNSGEFLRLLEWAYPGYKQVDLVSWYYYVVARLTDLSLFVNRIVAPFVQPQLLAFLSEAWTVTFTALSSTVQIGFSSVSSVAAGIINFAFVPLTVTDSFSSPIVFFGCLAYALYASRHDRPVFAARSGAGFSGSVWDSTVVLSFEGSDFKTIAVDSHTLRVVRNMSTRYYELHAYFLGRGHASQASTVFDYDVESLLPTSARVTPRDNFLTATENEPETGDAAVPTNIPFSTVPSANSRFKSGTLDVDAFKVPINSRGHVIRKQTVYRASAGKGHTFLAKSMAQILQVVGDRYLNAKPKPPLPYDASYQLYATEIVDRFFQRHMNEVSFDEALLDRVCEEAVAAAKTKGYDSQVQTEAYNARAISFHLKDIFKPTKGTSPYNAQKAGQGIAAWEKSAQVLFGASTRYINAVFAASLKSHVVYDNRMTPEQVMTALKAAAADVPSSALNGVTDFEMYDSQQDEFTQELEKAFLRKIGVDEMFIDWYYSFRKNYKIFAGPIVGTAGTEKTSGEPGTLLYNSIINVLLLDEIMEGEGPCVIAMKGDDGYKRQANLKVNLKRISRLAKYTKLTMKVGFEDPAEFCGCIIGKGKMAPSLKRRVDSIMGRSFKDYANYADYRKSLITWIKDIMADGEDGVNEVIALNASTFARPGYPLTQAMTETRAVFDDLVSLSHVNEEDFYRRFQAVQVETYSPVDNGGQHGVMVE